MKPIDKSSMDTLDNGNKANREHKVRQTLDNIIHSKPKPDETEKEFLLRKKVIPY